MHPLNDRMIKDLVKLHKRVNTGALLYPVEYDASVAISDNTLLIEWPKNMVVTCKRYFDLYDNCTDPRSNWRMLEDGHWRNRFLLHDRTIPVSPGSMEGDENEELFESIGGAVPFDTKVGRWYYHPAYIDMITRVIEEPTYQLYIPGQKQNMPKDIRLLCAFDGTALVAVVVDQPPREYSKPEVEGTID